jgi:hypothetical protein
MLDPRLTQRRIDMSVIKSFLAPMALALSVAGFVQSAGAQQLVSDSVVDARVTSAIESFYPSQLISTPAGIIDDKEVWVAKVLGLLQDAPAYVRESVLTAKTQNQFERALSMIEQSQSSELSRKMLLAQPAALGSGDRAKGFNANNLVYKPLTPCRIMDTRGASFASGVQGPIAGNVLKTIPGFLSAGANWGQYGGNATGNCGLGDPPGGNIYALAMVVTIINPNFSAFLGVSSSSNLATTLSTVALNFTAGQGMSSTYVVNQNTNQISFAMPTALSAQIIMDVVGYYWIGDATFSTSATALTCNNLTATSTETSVAANSTIQVNFPSCATGFTSTGIGCGIAGTYSQILLNEMSTAFGYCLWRNITGGAVSISSGDFRAERTCCQVPVLTAR